MSNSPEAIPDVSPSAHIYLRPSPVVSSVHVGLAGGARALPLAGGPHHFTGCEILVRDAEGVRAVTMDLDRLRTWAEALSEPQARHIKAQLDLLSSARPSVDGLQSRQARLMGVINVTPDSFYSGSRVSSLSEIRDRAHAMIDAGADIIDVGGESSRPGGAEPIGEDEELSRVIPVIESLAELPVLISVDTRHARVMVDAVAAGAGMINDIHALTGQGSLGAVAALNVPIVLMHCPADFASMHRPVGYEHVALDVFDWLRDRVEACISAGISRDRLIVDPGIGFVKQAPQSAAALARVSLMHGLGCPVLVGASRKSFIGRLAGGDTADDRLPGSLAAALWAFGQGVQFLRVHDVAQTRQAVALQAAIEDGLADATEPFSCTKQSPAD